MGGNMKRISSWDPLKLRFVKNISGWKVNPISIGGRLTLVKAVMGSLPNIGATNEALLRYLCEKINQVAIGEGSDYYVWSLSNDVGYSVSRTRAHIDDYVLPSAHLSTMWCLQVPRKINIFVWRLALDRLPTRLNLSRRGLEIKSISCVLCNHVMESAHHLMFECEVAVELWRRVRLWIDLLLPRFTEWTDWIAWFEDWRESEDTKARLYVIGESTVWHIWRFRNSQLFEQPPMKRCILFDSIRLFSFNW
ncbi:uncharacterized protein [Rutidosis leptorrhynchoides]|uniref:uncharacterized protein n=1 Tax=Rutidosis leptorrhynchoides TaxID=125765 RepID=UPI003A992E2F